MYCMNLYTGIRSNKLYMVYKKDLQISRTAVFERSCPEFPLDTNCWRKQSRKIAPSKPISLVNNLDYTNDANWPK